MSVSDPLIKELKACTSKFLQKRTENEPIVDSNNDLHDFCSTLEKIFYSGLCKRQNSLGISQCSTPFYWMKQLPSKSDGDSLLFAYKSAVETVQQFPNVQTPLGKFRLLVRFCLVFKCLHVPLQQIVSNDDKWREKYYMGNSIIGDEILVEILLSVLLQCSKIKFELDLKNSSFLDLSWKIPQVTRFELIPCENLGLGVSFAEGKAIIMNLVPNSVITEQGKVRVGDILDNLNGVHICCSTKGRLKSILHSNKKKPVTVVIIKAVEDATGDFYPPLIKLLKDVGLNLQTLKNRYSQTANLEPISKIVRNQSAGFKVLYVGNVEVGKQGDMRQIDKSAKVLLSPMKPYNKDNDLKSKKIKSEVFFEVGEIGLKIVDFKTSDILLKHSYMEISSCGSVCSFPNYFAYIAGDECCNTATSFICYIFHCNNLETVYTILQSIGQGFHRTHFAV